MPVKTSPEILDLQEIETDPPILEPKLRDIPRNIKYLPRLVLMAMIRFYQLTISRALPPNTCRFYPSCSRYGYQAIYKYGVLRGSIMAIWRVLRCNPFNPGGYDPVK